MTHQPPKRVIVFCLPGIGDAMQFTPAMTLLRQALPQAHITAITMFRGTADILSTNPDLNEVRHFDFFNASRLDGLRYIWSLRREGFDISIMTFPSNRLEYNVVNRLVGRRWRAAHRYGRQSWQNLWFLNNVVVRESGTLHNVAENIRLIRALCERVGAPLAATENVATPELKLTLTVDDEGNAEQFMSKYEIGAETMLFGFHTYSSTFKNMHRKCWEKDSFVQLIHRLCEAHPQARFLIFTGPSDEEVNEYIMKHADGGGRTLLVREANLRRAAAVLKRCRVFISNDSGLMHVAGALGVPIVALFGPTNWRRLHPWTPRHVVVRANLPCMPCFHYSSRPLRCVANINFACMREITVDEVFAAVQKLLTQTNANTITAQR